MSEARTTVLDELLDDPLVQMVMARDGVRPQDLRDMLERDRRRFAEKRPEESMVPPAHVIAACRSGSPCY